MTRRPRHRELPAPLVLALVLGLTACAGDSGNSADETAATGQQERADHFQSAIDEFYAVAIDLWDDAESFPTAAAQFKKLATRVAATMPDAIDPGAATSWTVDTYRGDYGGNKGLIACTPGDVSVRLVVPDDGRSIGFGVADGEVAAALVYDPAKVGEDDRFNEDGFYLSSSECATDDTELDADAKASRTGEY